MLSLAESLPGTRIRIFSGLEPGGIRRALQLAAAADSEDSTPCGGEGSSGGVGSDGGGGNGARELGLGTVIAAAAAAVPAAATTALAGESVGK